MKLRMLKIVVIMGLCVILCPISFYIKRMTGVDVADIFDRWINAFMLIGYLGYFLFMFIGFYEDEGVRRILRVMWVVGLFSGIQEIEHGLRRWGYHLPCICTMGQMFFVVPLIYYWHKGGFDDLLNTPEPPTDTPEPPQKPNKPNK